VFLAHRAEKVEQFIWILSYEMLMNIITYANDLKPIPIDDDYNPTASGLLPIHFFQVV